MKEWVFKLVVILIILMQLSCAHKRYNPSYNPEWASFHSKNYPCPEHTINIGDPRFPNYFVCRKIGIAGDIGLRLR